MAMTKEGLADAIFDEMNSEYEGTLTPGETPTKEYLKVLAAGIINYLKTNMDVLPGTFANSSGNVTGKGKVE